MSDLSAECRISSVCQTTGHSRAGFFLYPPKMLNTNSLFCILQALAIYSGDEIKAHLWDVGGVWWKKKNTYKFLVGKPEGKKSLKRHRRG